MFNKVDPSMDFAKREMDVMEFWEANGIFEKSVRMRSGGPVFTFYDGPPTANGKPHIGHVITRAYKDAVPRYKTMKGYKVLRKAGWDTHGLPVELEVEKELGLSGKQDIEKYGVEPFIQKCKESVWKYEREWREVCRRVGHWQDMDNPYITFHNEYIESVWWAIKQIWDKGLIYKGHKIVPYCPRCGTALSSHEVAQGYKNVKEDSAYVLFKAADADEYFVAWTTTPWTLPSNVALAVNPKENYVRAKDAEGRVLIVAEALAAAVLGEGHEVLSAMTGQDLERRKYEPLFDFMDKSLDAYYVVCADYVTLTDGTGIVHTAPAFGEEDYRSGLKYGLPFVNMVDERGCFVDAAGPWASMFVKDADPKIIVALQEQGALFSKNNYEHSYPFCWRCDTHLLYYARQAWFIKMTEVRDKLLANNDKINWHPDNIRTGRMGDWLKNVVDWGFSRERYWGTPLPVWECECGHMDCVGSIAELNERVVSEDKAKVDGLELHKPYIDEVRLSCQKCGQAMSRSPEVLDCWFDSGSMPFAQWHYPFENADIFDENYPADFISEAVDQCRGWFYTLMAISTLLFDEPSFKNCVVLGHIQDKNGQKMSKSKGNMVDVWDSFNKQGADAVRWYFYTFGAPWLSNRFNEDMLNEGQRKMLGTLWNAYAFFVLYANIDGFDPAAYKLPPASELSPMDRWALSRLNSLVRHVDENMEAYRLTEGAREIAEFTDDLSNWYIRRSRDRFWAPGMESDKVNAYLTLYRILCTLTELCAPYVPFVSENIYQNLVRSVDKNAAESVHLRDFPVCDDAYVDEELEAHMDLVLNIVERGRAARNTAGLKNRQPLAQMYVKAPAALPVDYHEIILGELNVKAISFTDDAAGFATYTYKPQLKTLGKKYGKLLPKIGAALANEKSADFLARLKNDGITLDIDGESVRLSEEDVLVSEAAGGDFATDSSHGVTVALDARLTPELIEEGFVREIVSKLQNMRRDADFNVTDKIRVRYQTTAALAGVIERNADAIQSQTLAAELLNEKASDSRAWDINGEAAEFGVEVIDGGK